MERPISDLDRSSDVYLRHVAHDLRASLNVVVSWAELVKAGRLSPEDLARAGDTIVRHTRHLSQRLSDALDVWRLDLGGLDVSTRPSAVGAVVKAAVDRARSQFERRRVECVVAPVADVSADVDPLRMAQALVVLLEDAATKTAPGQRVEVVPDVPGRTPGRAHRRGRAPAGAAAFDRTRSEPHGSAPERPFDFSLALARTLVELQPRHAGRRAGRRSRGVRGATADRPS